MTTPANTPKSPIYPVPAELAHTAHLNADEYKRLYAESLVNNDAFWGHMAGTTLTWHKPWKQVSDVDYHEPRIGWFLGGELNVSVNCLDRHIAERGDKPAIIWEPDDPHAEGRTLTYRQLLTEVSKTANALKQLGVTTGDRVCIYMPMVPEAAIAMLACARIGAIHNVVFGGFSAESLRERVASSESKVVITANEGIRGGKHIPLKAMTDEAVATTPSVKHVLVLKVTDHDGAMKTPRDVWWHDIVPQQPEECEPVFVEATHPLFILYTSGSTGKPKGVVHGSGGYLLYAALTHKNVFDVKENDVFWCTADVGWITGHSYVVYGPLANGATTLMFEGVPQYPDWSRFWQVIDKHKVSLFYTAPTAIRAIQAQGDSFVHATSRKSLRIIGSVGEPINPEAWDWYYNVVGERRAPIVDTWWQTETGGFLISPLPGATPLKPGCATNPMLGIEPVLLDEQGHIQHGETKGYLCIARSWPGQMQTLWNDHPRFKEAYFARFPGYYFSGDGATRDADGDYWITGRVDDVINVSGHRIGSAEVESALVLHPNVAEAAVVGVPHPIKGEAIYAFVTTTVSTVPSDELKAELIKLVRKQIGALATPDAIQWSPALPKTRSGKIMRRILRKITVGDLESLGDTSTLADPAVVEDLAKNRIDIK
ncbi:MAG: acetate--CoA ligase [Blastochloris viridis]|uniref:Acetyl-coenzyme A synthetase n=1 Tax=Blastochloris viridis TaxID=1079 RepID=A0A6N4R3N9_BLAVI|nr:MAG: acetate--CoA ligase [Blastochloris viridis]